MPPNKNWIDEVLQETEHVETPRSWLWYSLACSISAAMGNNYYLVTLKGAVVYKANLFVILMGESGLGKNFPVKLARRLVEKADVTRVIHGQASIQAIIQELSEQCTREKKGPLLDSRAFIVNGELSTAILRDDQALNDLTDLYDGNDNWTKRLKSGKERLKNPYLTGLFGSSPAHFYDSIPQVNIEGGYIGRNLLVEESKRYKDTDMFDEEEIELDENQFPFQKFVPHLENIESRGGRLVATPDAKTLFNNWRRRWREDQKPDKTGFLNRVPDHSLKLSMILALAELNNDALIISQGHMEEAIDRVTSLVYTNKRVLEGKGIDPLAAQTKQVLDILLKSPENKARRKTILNQGYGNFDAPTLDKILDTLKQHGWIETDRQMIKVGEWDIYVSLAGEPLRQYKEFMQREKNKK
jgi:hypothetical protein